MIKTASDTVLDENSDSAKAVTLSLYSLSTQDFGHRATQLHLAICESQIRVQFDESQSELTLFNPDAEALQRVKELARRCGIATTADDLKRMADAWHDVGEHHNDD